ncbi:OmpA/MotB family protein [Pinibacter aurantiacus]|uniref:OmpA family protein n=1 Tax=Pinibacter aurantiacus TaxID=2851599 RepID=A0A9E2S6F5_9BACT|nr:OmpA family protein [Pinibacter aurantiacus]MBV4356946.1 OmpA family protein [Pinibacter aurantiacus]
MTRKLIIPIVLICVVLFTSCAAKKKLAAAEAEITQLKADKADLASKNESLQKQLDEFDAQRKANMAAFEKYRAECEEAKQKLQVVRALVAEQYATLQEVDKKIADALANFNDKGVDVYYKDGLVYVSMAEGLLYKSGSATLGPDAKAALGNLASVLNEYPKLKVYVVGNTDDKPFKKGGDNMTLSTDRANGVVKILRDDYKVDPTRLTSAGRGKYSPVADNSTAEGRAKNRRTEIIINPDLIKIWQSVQDSQ